MIEEVTSQRLTRQIDIFKDFLNAAWPHLEKAMEEHDWDDGLFIDDWVQMNWEMLIERELFDLDFQLSPLFICVLLVRL